VSVQALTGVARTNLRDMAYTAQEARLQLLDDLARGTDELALGLACVGEAYDQLDEQSGDAVEEQLFRPLQAAYGRARRTHSGFASRYDLQQRTFEPRSPGTHANDPRVYLERTIEATERADQLIAELQDSMMPVEVGDTELRAGLSDVRSLIADLPGRGRRLLQFLGR
jgi:hypothetical protein